MLRKVVAINLKALGADHPVTARSHGRLALYLDLQDRPSEDIAYWKSAVAGVEGSRSAGGASGLERALGRDTSARSALAVALAQLGEPLDAWRNWEADLARGLLDDLSARQFRPLTVDQRRHEADLRGQLQALDEQIGRASARTSRSQDEDRRFNDLRERHSILHSQYVALENELNDQYGSSPARPPPSTKSAPPCRPIRRWSGGWT
ncbi:hypothetical protein ElP_13340 [Tautonia plasticadhaerens]|uniref:Tetratricopeptide repeat protein n=2 Tax=Tautonia plasticadhaerens TaxID=2527974 RepID=A0A518GY42_9BACT|nr:hypothetical protein [Tautonia plasticadhaerens]QDV33462.1 hypothetical protein ElP_13340 [Tautonia plasticadhaerens]